MVKNGHRLAGIVSTEASVREKLALLLLYRSEKRTC
jgi:hypothetical protein